MLRGLSRRHGRVYPRGSVIFTEGETGGEFYVVLSGAVEIAKETAGPDGRVEHRVLATLGPGAFFGEMGTFTGEPRSATAIAIEDTAVLYFDQSTAAQLLRANPQFGLDIIRTLCQRIRSLNGRLLEAEARARAPVPIAVPEAAAGVAGQVEEPALLPYDEKVFWAKIVECPVSHHPFSALNVRSQYLRAGPEESDFYRRYSGINPLHYVVLVCPYCYYASYPDDFASVSAEEAQQILADSQANRERDRRYDFRGERDVEHAARSFALALRAYQRRSVRASRLAQLYHHLAWIERDRENHQRELEYLRTALEHYRRAIDNERDLSPANELRMIYLIGELNLRLGLESEAMRWFGRASQHEHYKKQPQIQRLVEHRREVAREQAQKKAAARAE